MLTKIPRYLVVTSSGTFASLVRRLEHRRKKPPGDFWEVDVNGLTLTIRHGKIGTPGKVEIKQHTTEGAAAYEAQTKFKAKLKKGWVEVEVALAREPAVSERPRNRELETAILDDLDDVSAWVIYADWLQTRDDPWGERIALSLQLEQSRGEAEGQLEARLAELDSSMRKVWQTPRLARLLQRSDIAELAELEWTHGFVTKLTVETVLNHWGATTSDELVRALVRAPVARFLRHIRINGSRDAHAISLVPTLSALAEVGELWALRELIIDDDESWYRSEFQIADLEAILRAAPNLEILHVRGDAAGLNTLAHEHLRELELELGEWSMDTAAAIGRATLPACMRLRVVIGQDLEWSSDGEFDLRSLLTGAGLPRLEELALHVPFDENLLAELARSNVLKQLRRLDLSYASADNAGTEQLLATASRFAHLERLGLHLNHDISPERWARIEAVLPNAELTRIDDSDS